MGKITVTRVESMAGQRSLSTGRDQGIMYRNKTRTNYARFPSTKRGGKMRAAYWGIGKRIQIGKWSLTSFSNLAISAFFCALVSAS